MSISQTRLGWGLVVACMAAGIAWSLASPTSQRGKAAHELMPASTVAYFSQDGSLKHDDAWKKTAAYETMYESGIVATLEKVGEFVQQQMPTGPNEEKFAKAMEGLEQHGFSAGIALTDVGMPSVTIVLHNAAGIKDDLAELTDMVGPQMGMPFEVADLGGRKMHVAVIPNTPGIEVAFTAEAGHLVITAGVAASEAFAAVASGDAPNLSANPVWKKYNFSTSQAEATTVAWLDTGKIADAFGRFPVPETNATVADVLKALGLHNLDALALQYGYKGRALWTETHFATSGERTGILGVANSKLMTLADLPPVPEQNSGFSAFRCDPALVWDSLLNVARDVVALGPPEAQGQIDSAMEQMEAMLGFNPREALLEPMGDIVCVYTDSGQGFFGTGTGVVVKVDDAAKLSQTMDRILDMISGMSDGEFTTRKVQKRGRSMTLFRFANRAEVGAMMIDENWMVLGLMPQTCEAFAMRLDGDLPSWKPSEEQAAAFAELPREFSSISVGDPRVAWATILKLAPAGLVAAEAFAREEGLIPEDMVLPISPADVPPAEMVTRSLFDNVTVGVVDEGGLHTMSRQSLPGIPFLGGGGDAGSVGTTAVLVALLLPAVQQAREAARRTQSKNNLKQLALAMHNYHDVYNGFPAGTHPNEKLKPDQRLSWMTRLLPFAEQIAAYERLDFEEGWDDEANAEIVRLRMPVFMHPSLTDDGEGPGPTHYVGLAGVGQDGPELPVDHARAGMFAHNRRTRLRDVRDGTSNTVMISEASRPGVWAQGGLSSYRPITRKPYINGPDGIGGPSPGGCNMAFGDGSVRFISENIDPEVFEALNTINGGEVVGPF